MKDLRSCADRRCNSWSGLVVRGVGFSQVKTVPLHFCFCLMCVMPSPGTHAFWGFALRFPASRTVGETMFRSHEVPHFSCSILAAHGSLAHTIADIPL